MKVGFGGESPHSENHGNRSPASTSTSTQFGLTFQNLAEL